MATETTGAPLQVQPNSQKIWEQNAIRKNRHLRTSNFLALEPSDLRPPQVMKKGLARP